MAPSLCLGQKQLGKRRSKFLSFAAGQTCHTFMPSGQSQAWVVFRISRVVGPSPRWGAFHQRNYSRGSTFSCAAVVAAEERNCQKDKLTLVKYLHRTEPWPAEQREIDIRTAG